MVFFEKIIFYMPGKIWYSEFWSKTYRKLKFGRVLAGKLFFKSKWLLLLKSVVTHLYNPKLVFWSLIFSPGLFFFFFFFFFFKSKFGRVLAGKLFSKSKWLLVLKLVVIQLYNPELVFCSLIFNLGLYNLIGASVMKHKVKWSPLHCALVLRGTNHTPSCLFRKFKQFFYIIKVCWF